MLSNVCFNVVRILHLLKWEVKHNLFMSLTIYICYTYSQKSQSCSPWMQKFNFLATSVLYYRMLHRCLFLGYVNAFHQKLGKHKVMSHREWTYSRDQIDYTIQIYQLIHFRLHFEIHLNRSKNSIPDEPSVFQM